MNRSSSRCRTASRALARGFTLIELMIVVAIVGMLAAIAMPQYQVYTGKAQLTEALHLTEGRKTVIAERLQFGHSMASINGGTDGIPLDIPTGAGRYVESLVIASGTIVAIMRTIGVSTCAGGETITLAPLPPSGIERPISWVCSTTAVCKPQTCA
ncbi:MAG: pilin [Betaproteobacteria bacterium]